MNAMKHLAIIFLIIIIPNLLDSKEPSNDELFIIADKQYRDRKYDEAIQTYERILENGFTNGYVLYNLGNSHFKKDEIGKAILFYERAHRLIPRDQELNDNLNFVKAFTQDKIEEKKPAFLFFMLMILLNNFTLKEVFAFVSALFSVTLFCSILYHLKRNILLKNVMISFLTIFLLSGFLLSAKYRVSIIKRGVILMNSAQVKSAPSDEATVEFIIHEGTDFVLLETMGEWSKIRLKDAKSGWIRSETFHAI
ncbi:MAG: tetratricopeptide repeat protein [Candidatus Cloacimonadota bacterium]|nr:MAG: tetratricopeptide repeat protein [Candidatus Cloacimonadota bacterium]